MKNIMKLLIPILFLLIAVGSVIGFEFYLKPNFNTEAVVVASQDIGFKDEITEEDIRIEQIKKDQIINGSLSSADINLILNKNASINIKKGTQIYLDLIDSYDLIPNEKNGEFIAPIPSNWLFAVPGSLRRTYIADFYAIASDEQKIIKSLIEESGNKKEDNKDQSDGVEEFGESENTNTTDVLETNEEIDDVVIKNWDTPILTDVRVSSVKDNSNKEVTESPTADNVATGSISNLEIIATQETLDTIRRYTEQGFKIYVVYRYERSE